MRLNTGRILAAPGIPVWAPSRFVPVSAVLPWAVIAGGLLLTLLAALLAERLVRGRADAERLSREVGDLYMEQRSVAETLQQVLLPQRLPDISWMQIQARYLPGASGVDIGGDWYDVVPLEDGRFVFKVGDVSGRGVKAAAVMASLHFAGRAYALEGHPPQVILDQLAQTLDVAQDGRFATVLCGLVDVAAHTVTLASAGHLPPLIRNGGEATPVTMKPGPPSASQVAHRMSRPR
jgi:serine phosphatase RsbU (regulator of sigma subunit)